MPLPRETPPRSRTNDLLDYAEVVADLRTTPGDWCKVGSGVSTSDADKIVRTLKQYPLTEGLIELATRGATDDTRNVYAVYTGPAAPLPDTDDDDPAGGAPPAPEKPKGVK